MAINHEQLEVLPYLAYEITPEERSQVEKLIQVELSRQNTSVPHPLLDQNYVEDEDEDEDDERDHVSGIDISRYSDTLTSSLYTTMSYAILQSRNDETLTAAQYSATYSQHIQRLISLNDSVESTIGSKRKALQELNTQRKKLHEDHQSLNGYLSEQWKEAVKSVVNLGVERKRIELDL